MNVFLDSHADSFKNERWFPSMERISWYENCLGVQNLYNLGTLLKNSCLMGVPFPTCLNIQLSNEFLIFIRKSFENYDKINFHLKLISLNSVDTLVFIHHIVGWRMDEKKRLKERRKFWDILAWKIWKNLSNFQFN